MAESNGNGNGNGNVFLKIISGLLVILAVISGVASIVAPMQKSIDNNQRGIDLLETSLRRDMERQQGEIDYLKKFSSTESASRFAEQEQKFMEVETQFKWQKEIFLRHVEDSDKMFDKLDRKIEKLQEKGGVK